MGENGIFIYIVTNESSEKVGLCLDESHPRGFASMSLSLRLTIRRERELVRA
jgi:hypothetical protein